MADTKRSILLAVRDQARMTRGELAAGDPEAWSQQQWWEAFQFLFVSGAHCSSGGGFAGQHQQADDLLFFVRKGAPAAARAGPVVAPQPGEEPFFVRRRARKLPGDLLLSGAEFPTVDWGASVLLNIVLQAQYQLTVVACGRDSLAFVAEGRTWTPNMRTVSKSVYASPTVTAVNLDSSRASDATPLPCYPNICFAVDNFEDAFEELVLHEAEHCYCVVLHAMLDDYGAAAPQAHDDFSYPDLETLTARLTSSRAAATAVSDTSAQAASSTAAQPQGPASSLGMPDTGKSGEQLQQQGASTSSSSHQLRAPVSAAGPSLRLPSIVGSTAEAAEPGEPSASGNGTSSSSSRPPPMLPGTISDDASPMAWQIGTRKRTLFAGYVGFVQLVDFMAGNRQRGLLGAILGGGPAAPQKDKVIMTGPGGTGRAEVAVTKVEQTAGVSGDQQVQPEQRQQQQQQQQQQSASSSRGPGWLMRARQVASGLQKAVAQAAPGGFAACKMQCSLMLLKLPVSYLAQELLDSI